MPQYFTQISAIQSSTIKTEKLDLAGKALTGVVDVAMNPTDPSATKLVTEKAYYDSITALAPVAYDPEAPVPGALVSQQGMSDALDTLIPATVNTTTPDANIAVSEAGLVDYMANLPAVTGYSSVVTTALWGTADVDGQYTYEVTAATHKQGANPMVALYDTTTKQLCFPSATMVADDGKVTLVSLNNSDRRLVIK